MRQKTTVTFAMRDLDRLKCQAVVDGDLKPIRSADWLGMTTRQVRRLARGYATEGPVELVSRRFDRPSNNRLYLPIRRSRSCEARTSILGAKLDERNR